MSMLETLFGLIPAESRGQQWVADELQLVNWGGYDGGPHRVKFSPTSTLLCGGSGSGKSTLMDAYIALMMPHTTPFNGASNGGITGRPRGQDQRNILSYGRGKLDETRTADGTRVRVLRGEGSDTWTAVSMTWADHDGSRFTAVRAWYIPAQARTLEDTTRVRATIDDTFDLGRLDEAVRHRLSDASVKALGLTTFPTDREFSARLHATLGIGAAGSGAKAISLLSRIQAGQQITTVDELYKRMVLEEPETIAAAAAVVEHFDGLESTRTRMITARQQVDALLPIRDLRARIEAAAGRLRMVAEVGQFSDPESPASLWRARRRLGLLQEGEEEVREEARRADALVRDRETSIRAAEDEESALAQVLRDSGGDRLDTARRELRGLESRALQVAQDRDRLDEALRVLGAEAANAKQFATLVEAAHAGLDDADAKEAARGRFADARATVRRVQQEVEDLQAELHQTMDRSHNIPADLHDARAALARAAGLTEEDLPFVAELVEVRTEFEPWRDAFNLALGGFARTLLIDVAHLARFRSAINSVPTRQRLHFEGVPTGQKRRDGLDPRTLPGRLDYRNSPFTGWLQQRLEDRFDFVCVASADQLHQHQRGLTITGQVSQGHRGAHGGQGVRNVLGFSNVRRVNDLKAMISDAQLRLGDAADAEEQARRSLDELDARRDAFRIVRGLRWDQVDVERLASERARWEAIIEEVTTGNPDIARMTAQLEKARQRVNSQREDLGRAKQRSEDAHRAWAELTDEVDRAERVVEAAEDDDRSLTAEQQDYLDDQFAVVTPGEGGALQQLERFDAALKVAAQRLAEEAAAAQQDLVEHRETLHRTLRTFLERWPNPNLLADPDHSVGDFERILADLESSGLHQLEKEWRDSLLKLSGNDLTNLDSTLSRALREIKERIEPINQIMQDLPFYDDDHRLQITTRANQSEVRKRFRRELREVREVIEEAQSDADREDAYRRMARLIARIRPNAPDVAELIDVRNHVRVSAERVHAITKEHVSLYDHIGEKSGGESQELVAFIVGAALRYQLGDAGAERPRYAPVFLDEALIKADAHFTRRAIGAWRGLGFQLVIGAPNDKYSAIEPHVDVEYDILKDTRGRSWAKLKVALPVEK